MGMREAVHPRQVVLVSVRGSAEALGKEVHRDNIITLAWHTPLSFDPEMYGICVGKNRFSYKLIKQSRAFAVNFASHDMKDPAVYCGTSTGANVEKFDRPDITKQECEKIDCPCIAEAVAVLECELVEEVETGDHVFFIGKVLRSDVRDDKARLFHCGADQFTTTHK